MTKLLKAKSTHLYSIIFSHFFSVFLSAFYDEASHNKSIKITGLKYGLWFFSYWSAGTSLLTVPWTIWTLHRLNKKKKKETFFKQLIDCIVLQVNFISGVVFCGGGFLLTFPRKDWLSKIKFLPFYGFFGKTTKLWVGLLYNFFWHFWAPLMVIIYFGRHCQTDLLAKRRKSSLCFNLLVPTVYFVYVLSRAKFFNFTNKFSSGGVRTTEPFHYPYDYPYPFFYGCAGKKFSAASENSFLGVKGELSLFSSLIGTLITVSFGGLIFSLLLYWIIAIKKKEEDKINVKGSVFSTSANF